METKRTTVPALEEIIEREFSVLDHGFIRLIDYMGSDESIVQAARVSYGKGTKKVNEDKGLIRYLMRHRHTTPFEMCEIKFHVKLPIFVARQWIRHRTANVNEYSARYSVLDREFYVPAAAAEQSRINNQGRGVEINLEQAMEDLSLIRDFSAVAYNNYLHLLNLDENGDQASDSRVGMARELARIVLPTNYYTQWYWKIDLHNLFHFLSLRTDNHAQLEIRAYAEQIAHIVKSWVPVAFEAFEDYSVNAIQLSAPERRILSKHKILDEITNDNSLSAREWQEFLKKMEPPDAER